MGIAVDGGHHAPSPLLGTDPTAAERARLEDHVQNLRERVIRAATSDEARRARALLDEAEERLLVLERARGHCGCEGWPEGK